jgi:hypothetical protein
MREEELPLALI